MLARLFRAPAAAGVAAGAADPLEFSYSMVSSQLVWGRGAIRHEPGSPLCRPSRLCRSFPSACSN